MNATCAVTTLTKVTFYYMKFNNRTGYDNQEIIIKVNNHFSGLSIDPVEVEIIPQSLSAKFAKRIILTLRKGCRFQAGYEQVDIELSNLTIHDTGFYYCRYDQVYQDSTWVIVFPFSPLLLQAICIIGVLALFAIIFCLGWCKEMAVQKRRQDKINMLKHFAKYRRYY